MTPKINLAPDRHQAKVKAKRSRQLILAISFLVTATSVGIMVALFLVAQGQNLAIRLTQNAINDDKTQINQYKQQGLQDAVTTQRHLDSLPVLYSQRVYLSKFFDVLISVSPQGFGVSRINIDSQNVIKFNGRAKSYTLAAKFAKALEASNVTIGSGAAAANTPYFSNIDLSGVSAASDGSVDFSVTATMSKEVTNGQK